jgi:nifR3 family TIM-barrel protein
MHAELAKHLDQTLRVGGKTIEKRVVLSPMAFVGNIAFRELVAEFGGYGLLFSEMCSAKRIPSEDRHKSSYFRWRDEESSQLVCQIFGADPAIMAAAAKRIENEGFFGVDLNFGCSDGSICRQNCGAAILQNPDMAFKITSAVRNAISIPLFVKFRIGWRDDPQLSVALATGFEGAGADALTFHPRVAPDRRSRPPKWEYIGLVKQAVSIPVFGNGNVFDGNDCLRMLQATGCDGVAVGRMAIAKPWIFAQWSEGLTAGPERYQQAASDLADMLENHFDPAKSLRRFKRFAYYFAANFEFGHTLYTRLSNVADMNAIRAELDKFFADSPRILSRPNLNFFS